MAFRFLVALILLLGIMVLVLMFFIMTGYIVKNIVKLFRGLFK